MINSIFYFESLKSLSEFLASIGIIYRYVIMLCYIFLPFRKKINSFKLLYKEKYPET